MKKCRKCLGKSEISPEEIEKMVDEVRNMKGVRLVSEEEYSRRFAVCEKCEKLEDGTTCMLCGCVMQVRARLADGKCPYPRGGRWQNAVQ